MKKRVKKGREDPKVKNLKKERKNNIRYMYIKLRNKY